MEEVDECANEEFVLMDEVNNPNQKIMPSPKIEVKFLLDGDIIPRVLENWLRECYKLICILKCYIFTGP